MVVGRFLLLVVEGTNYQDDNYYACGILEEQTMSNMDDSGVSF